MPVKKELSEQDKKLLSVIAANIKWLMQTNDISFRDLADDIDESKSTLHNYLSLRNPISIPIMNKIAERFNKSLDWLTEDRSKEKGFNSNHCLMVAENEEEYNDR